MEELKFVEKLLLSVSDYICKQYLNKKDLKISTKKHANDLLTEVDVNVQQMLVKSIKEQYPNDLIVGEESGLDEVIDTKNKRAWVLDPIDGTQNFVRGLFPLFGVSIGFVVNERPEVAGIIFPVTKEVFLAKRGGGAFHNGKRIKVSQTSSLSNSRIDFDMGALDKRDSIIKTTTKLAGKVGQIRSFACAVMGFCQVANGEQDAYICFSLNPWDVAAGMLIVEEAGGIVSSLSEEITSPFDSDKICVISNAKLHKLCIDNLT